MSNLCKAPWMNIQLDVNGTVRPCCRYAQQGQQTKYKMPNIKNGNLEEVWNDPKMIALRKAFLDGEKPAECSWCWREEAAGIRSFRDRYNEREYDVDTSSTHSDLPVMFDLKVSNVCNLKCRMCSPHASSLILKEQKVLGKKFPEEAYFLSNKILGTENEKIFFDNLHRVKEIELTGGEPFFSKENKDLLGLIIDSGHAKNIKLQITTNGTIYDRKTMDHIEQFKNPRFALSIDDVGDRLTYARGGADWEKVKANIIRFKKHNVNLCVYRTISFYNIWYLAGLDKFCLDQDVRLASGFVHEPEHLSIRNLPKNIKEEIRHRYASSNSMGDVFDFMGIEGRFSLDLFKHIKDLDRIRLESFVDTFPEWAEMVMYYE